MIYTGTCSNCGKEDVPIVMHHTDYENDVTIPLCRSCHQKIHTRLRIKGTPLSPPKGGYTNISLPVSLVDEIDKLVGSIEYRTKFVKDACRRRLEYMGIVSIVDERTDTEIITEKASGRGAPGQEPPIPRGMPSGD